MGENLRSELSKLYTVDTLKKKKNLPQICLSVKSRQANIPLEVWLSSHTSEIPRSQESEMKLKSKAVAMSAVNGGPLR